MNDSRNISIETVLGRRDDGSGRPRTLLYEVFEKHGKALQKPVFEWSCGESAYPVNPETAQNAERMIAEGTLTRGPGEYVHHLGGHAQRLRLTNG